MAAQSIMRTTCPARSQTKNVVVDPRRGVKRFRRFGSVGSNEKPTATDATIPAGGFGCAACADVVERDAVAAERDALAVERDALLERNERVHHILLKLRRLQFGPKSEEFDEDQLHHTTDAKA